MTLVPAYGRDYKSAKAAQESYLSGQDWRVADISSQWNGSYCSCRDFVGKQVQLRYKKLTCVTQVTFTGESK